MRRSNHHSKLAMQLFPQNEQNLYRRFGFPSLQFARTTIPQSRELEKFNNGEGPRSFNYQSTYTSVNGIETRDEQHEFTSNDESFETRNQTFKGKTLTTKRDKKGEDVVVQESNLSGGDLENFQREWENRFGAEEATPSEEKILKDTEENTINDEKNGDATQMGDEEKKTISQTRTRRLHPYDVFDTFFSDPFMGDFFSPTPSPFFSSIKDFRFKCIVV